MKIEATDNFQKFISERGQPIERRNRRKIAKKMYADGIVAYRDFQRDGNEQNLELAMSKFKAAANVTLLNDPCASAILNNLGACYLHLFRKLWRITDLQTGIDLLEVAVGMTKNNDPSKPSRLNNLGGSLLDRFRQFGNLDDVHNAIVRQQAAVSLTPDGHPEKPNYLNSLGTALGVRFEQLGNRGDIDEAITQQRNAISLTSDGDLNKLRWLSGLGGSLIIRSQRLGSVDDIDAAITQLQAVVNLSLDDHPDRHSYLNNLGCCLRFRFERLGNRSDIDSAITLLQAAVDLISDDHSDRPLYLSNLGGSLGIRFERSENLDDLNGAITYLQLAVNLAPDAHPNKPGFLSNLGISLQMRFARLGNLKDIYSAITQQRAAVNLTPDSCPEKFDYLTSLGNTLQLCFERLGSRDYIDDAIAQQQAAVNLTPDDHHSKASCLRNLGYGLSTRFRHFRQSQDADAAISLFSRSAQSSLGSPTIRFWAAGNWISLASLIRHHSLLTAYELALDLMPLVVWLGLPITDRHQRLVEIGWIARDAAAAAISLEQYDKAVEWLEQGRSIVWNQILQLRTPVDELRSVDPNLADHLVQVSQLLDRGTEKKEKGRSTEEDAQQYRALTGEWESIIQKIRSIPNFEHFLKPHKTSRLMDAARDGPVVVFNIAKDRCDALALVAGMGEVIHIPLPNITFKRVTELRDTLKDLLYSNGIRMRDVRAAQKWTDDGSNDSCKNILAELWTGLVKPVLDCLAFSVRLTWPLC
jgi:tetratricopeptide (TPR) repeat protein